MITVKLTTLRTAQRYGFDLAEFERFAADFDWQVQPVRLSAKVISIAWPADELGEATTAPAAFQIVSWRCPCCGNKVAAAIMAENEDDNPTCPDCRQEVSDYNLDYGRLC